MKHVMRRAPIVLLLASIAVAMAGAQAKRAMTETDLFKFTWIADPQISPDGSAVAFVRVTVNEKENRYETSLFLAAAAAATNRTEPRRLTSTIRDTAPRWSPDGKRIAFIRSIEKDGKAQPGQVYLLEMSGGEAHPLTHLARGVQSPVWSPDGRTIAFTSTAPERESLRSSARSSERLEVGPQARQENDGSSAESGYKSDVRVITRAVYRANGNPNFLEPDRHSHIWTVGVGGDAAAASDPTMITSGEFDERGIAWSRDGAAIYFTSTRVPEAYYEPPDSDLYSVPAAGGAVTKIASIDGTIGNIAVSHDGTRLAFVGTLHGNPVRSFSQSDLWVTDAAPGSTPRNLTAGYDFDIAGGIGGDQAAPRGDHPKPVVWSADDRSLIVPSAEHGSSNLKRFLVADGRVAPVTDGAHDIASYTATSDASTIAAVISTQTAIGDVFIVRGDSETVAPQRRVAVAPQRSAAVSGLRQITDVNHDLFAGIEQSEPEEMWYTSFDGKRIQSWILKPPAFDASKKYPLILEIHGGPHSAYGNTYTHEFQWMAAKGYVVLFTNPRGSTSYGQDFGNIIQFHYPGDDYKDLMAGVDEILKRGYIDEKRMGVTGGSGGGLLTDWTMTQTQRFAAAVAQRDIADWYGFWFTADFSQFDPSWFRKAPWEDPDDYHQRSPITHIGNVTTPLMLILGDQDYRTPPADGGEMMFRALKYRKIPTAMVRFPRENHELSRSGEPWHRIERLRHIVGWMDQYLQGKKSAAYSTAQP